MIYFYMMITGLIFLLLYQYWKNKKLLELSQNEISHFSNIGFTNLLEDQNLDKMKEKISTEGIGFQNWKMMEFGSGIELWVADPASKNFVFQPFFRGNSHLYQSDKFFPINDFEGVELITIDDDVRLFAELIPFQEQNSDSIFVTAFGVEITLYDSVYNYETIVKSKFKRQLISIPYLSYQENPNDCVPSGEVIISGIIKEHERKTNQETGMEFWHVRIEIKENVLLDAVWDYRLADRFPQKGNVLVGNFYLFASHPI